MEEQRASVLGKCLDSPDEVRRFVNKGRPDIVHPGSVSVGRFVLEPGWTWSEHVRAIAGTESRQVQHIGYVLSGKIKVVMDDGTGDAAVIPPGHDAWIVGDEPCVWLEGAGADRYAVDDSQG